MDSMVGRAVILESKDRPLTCGDPVAYNSSAVKPCRDFGLSQMDDVPAGWDASLLTAN